MNIPEGASATQTLSNVARVMAGLDPKPPVSDYDLQRAAEALKKPVEEWPEWKRGNLEAYGNHIAKDAAWRAEQKAGARSSRRHRRDADLHQRQGQFLKKD